MEVNQGRKINGIQKTIDPKQEEGKNKNSEDGATPPVWQTPSPGWEEEAERLWREESKNKTKLISYLLEFLHINLVDI